nr:hydroxymethylbilane synthase [Acidobacteriota bacterium]
DLAVHSLKDLPTQLPAGLAIAVITEREDARDALVLREAVTSVFPSLDTLPAGAVVGTSSPRRLAQLKHFHPHLRIKELRGNVDTRLRKLDAGEYDAIILAVAGLSRLGFAHRISERIQPGKMLPAVGQGALAIEIRADDAGVHDFLAPLDHGPTRAACTAERALLRALGGGCQLPIAAHAVVREEHLKLDGLVAAPSGETLIREAIKGKASEAAQLGEALAGRLIERGANSLIAGLII